MKAKRWLATATIVGVAIVDWVIKPLSDAYIQSHVPDWLPTESTVLPVLQWIRAHGLGFATAALLFGFWDPIGDALRRWVFGSAPGPRGGMIYLGHPAIWISDVANISALELSVMSFNALPFDVRLIAIEGNFRIEGRSADGGYTIENLEAPLILFERGPANVPSMTEFMPVLSQRLTTEQSLTIRNLLAKGRIVLRIDASAFVFERLDQPRTRITARASRSPSLGFAAQGDLRQSTAAYLSLSSVASAQEG